jgi:cobaltochelatase CobS
MTTTELATLKRTELQQAACRQFGKSAASWTGRATNEELREALMSGEVPAKFANGTGQQDLAVAIAAAINPLLQAQLDEGRVMEMIEERVAELSSFIEAKLAERQTITTFEVHRPDGTRINVGRTHRQLEELLSWVDAGCWPFLIGPAGSFKTSAATKVAEALGRPFHMDSMSEGKTPFDLLGFNDATGRGVHTELRKAWEHGGVFLADELDAGNANVLATLNALLSQPIAAFPDGMIPRHEAFVFIAAGNTTGAGADMKFVGRNQLDGATLDRFVFVFWEIDEDFEVYVAGDDQREWTHYVQKCRRAAAACGITENVVFATPRASINGAKALRRGKLSRPQVEQALLWGRLSAEDAAKVKANLWRN